VVRKRRGFHDDEYMLGSYFRGKKKTIKEKQERTRHMYKIPYESGKMYTDETGGLLAARLREHTYNLKEHLATSNWQWKQGGILQFKPIPTYRKYKQTAHTLNVEISLFGST
jgi:hypothetical protein